LSVRPWISLKVCHSPRNFGEGWRTRRRGWGASRCRRGSDGSELDAANDALAADAAYVGMLDEAGDLFVAGSSERIIAMRMP